MKKVLPVIILTGFLAFACLMNKADAGQVYVVNSSDKPFRISYYLKNWTIDLVGGHSHVRLYFTAPPKKNTKHDLVKYYTFPVVNGYVHKCQDDTCSRWTNPIWSTPEYVWNKKYFFLRIEIPENGDPNSITHRWR